MKPLLILMRIVFVGIFWSIFFLEGIRVIMLKNWRFDIVRPEHWRYAWDLWLSGWIIDDTKEWAFVLIILTFIPLWLTGWAALSLLSWEKMFISAALLPITMVKKFFFQPVKIIAHSTGVKKIKKKKSYKEIRPKSIRAPIDERIYETANTASPKPIAGPSTPAITKIEETKESKFDHSLFKFDEEDDFDFDFDAFDNDKKTEPAPQAVEEAPAKNNNKNNNKEKDNNNKTSGKDNNNNKDNKQNKGKQVVPSNLPTAPTASNPPSQSRSNGNSTLDVIKQKGYEVINGVTIKNNLIDFIGIGANQIVLCLIDKEPGDWLADEERFNDEEPLWFSESSHRISPVRKIDISRQALVEKLESADFHFDVKAYIVVQIGNIINAEDMFEIWDDLGICVTRIDRGTPKELKLFSKTLEESSDPVEKDKLEKIKKLVRGLV